MISGIVERKQTATILSNVLLTLKGSTLQLTGTDSEIELIGSTQPLEVFEEGSTTLSARKLFEISKSLPENSEILIKKEQDNVILSSGNSKFTLLTIAPEKFPSIEPVSGSLSITLDQQNLKKIIDSTSFAMSTQDIRFYLNAMLFEISDQQLRVVAIDGYRMAISDSPIEIHDEKTNFKFIMPRKGVFGLSRLVSQSSNQKITLTCNEKHIRANIDDFIFTSALIDCRFPSYNRAIPKKIDKFVLIQKEPFRDALNRAAILSYEKNKKVLFFIEQNQLIITSENPEHENAEEILSIQYEGPPIKVCFNVHYLLNVLAVVSGQTVSIGFAQPTDGVIMNDYEDKSSIFIIMPMNL